MCEASRGAGAQSVSVNATDCGFDPQSRNIYILFFIFEFRHLTRKASRIRRTVDTGVS